MCLYLHSPLINKGLSSGTILKINDLELQINNNELILDGKHLNIGNEKTRISIELNAKIKLKANNEEIIIDKNISMINTLTLGDKNGVLVLIADLIISKEEIKYQENQIRIISKDLGNISDIYYNNYHQSYKMENPYVSDEEDGYYDDSAITTRIASEEINTDIYNYSYDSLGNIIGINNDSYSYDNHNYLIKLYLTVVLLQFYHMYLNNISC